MVPSSGSTTQLQPARALPSAPPSSPRNPSCGRRAGQQLADRTLGGTDRPRSRDRWACSCSNLALAPAAGALQQQRRRPCCAASTRHREQLVARPCPRLTRSPAGAAPPRGARLRAARRARSASPRRSGRANELHRARQPIGGEARGHRAGRLAGEVPARRVGHRRPPPTSCVHSQPRPSQAPIRGGGAGGHRRQQHVVIDQQLVHRAA